MSDFKKDTVCSFKISTPEEEGLPSSAIINFIDELEYNNIDMHSLLIFRNNNLIFEGYYKPFERNTLHRMFSITKSFVSAAIGILEKKGKLNLDSFVIDYFPEYYNYNIHPFVKATTVRDLLKMQSPHISTAFKQIDDDDYVKSFFVLEPSKIPGTVFSYDSSASHTLCALAEKISSKSLLDFLKDEFLRELGFSEEAYCIKDPFGITRGDSGLMARPLDVAVLAHVFLNNGKYYNLSENIQIMSENYVLSAVSKQSDTFIKGSSNEEKFGYGYQIWRTSHNGFMFYGIAGQLALILPDFNFVMVTCADTFDVPGGVQKIFDLFWKNIYNFLNSKTIQKNIKDFFILQKVKDNLKIQPIFSENSFCSKNFIDKKFNVLENIYDIHYLSIEILNDDMGRLIFESLNGVFKLNFGIGKCIFEMFPYYNYKCVSSGAFFGEKTLIIKSSVIDEEIGTVYFQIDFNDSNMGVFTIKKNNILPLHKLFNHTYFINAM